MSTKTPKTKRNEAGPGPLSHSSATTLLGCEQKLHLYKIAKVAPDPDYVKSEALGLGSAFHWILERSLHSKPDSISADLEACVTDPDIFLSRDDMALCHAMVLRYLRLHKRMGFTVLAVEVKIETEELLGYIDAIMLDPVTGKWWIVDLKTYKSLTPASLPVLIRDPQLSLYASQAASIAIAYNLKLGDFGGCRWRVVTKSSARMQPKEDYIQFVQRLVDKHITAYDIPVPLELMDPDERLEIHHQLWRRYRDLASGKSKPVKNYANCRAFYSACEYTSHCFGKMASDLPALQVTEE